MNYVPAHTRRTPAWWRRGEGFWHLVADIPRPDDPLEVTALCGAPAVNPDRLVTHPEPTDCRRCLQWLARVGGSTC